MTYKKLLVLGAAALLVAGCSADVTSPIRSVSGAATSSNVTTLKKGTSGTGARTATQASDSASTCFSVWPINSGFVGDSTCTSQP